MINIQRIKVLFGYYKIKQLNSSICKHQTLNQDFKQIELMIEIRLHDKENNVKYKKSVRYAGPSKDQRRIARSFDLSFSQRFRSSRIF